MRRLLTHWRRQSRHHPSLLYLAAAGLLAVAASPVLAAVGLGLLAQLFAGLSLAPLGMALYLVLLPVGPWPDDDGNGGGWGRGGGTPPDSPGPLGDPGGGIDWERFERDFRAYAERRVPVA